MTFAYWKHEKKKNKIIALQHTLQTFGLLMVQSDVSGLEKTDGIISSEYIITYIEIDIVYVHSTVYL